RRPGRIAAASYRSDTYSPTRDPAVTPSRLSLAATAETILSRPPHVNEPRGPTSADASGHFSAAVRTGHGIVFMVFPAKAKRQATRLRGKRHPSGSARFPEAGGWAKRL